MQKGFGFLSILLLASFISALSISVIFMIDPQYDSNAVNITNRKASILGTAITKYRDTHNTSAPANLSALITDDGSGACDLDNTPANPTYQTLQGWCGPYIEVNIQENSNDYQTDGWGNTFTFTQASGLLKSCGPDGTCGNADDLSYTF